MNKSANGLGALKAKTANKVTAKAPTSTTEDKPKRQPQLVYRLSNEDRIALNVYATQNGTSAQALLTQALRLLALEKDIPLSDKIMKP